MRKKFSIFIFLALFLVVKSSIGQVKAQIEQANKKGKTVFLVVYEREGADKDKAVKIAREAHLKRAKTTTVIELNKSDKANNELITKYRLAGAPMPLLLVIDKNGIPAGGLVLANATADALIKIIPSAKHSEILKAINDQKGVLIVAYKIGMVNKTKAIENCKKAIKSMNNGAVMVELNIDDANEANLIKQLKVNTSTTEPIIYTVNKLGQITGIFDVNASTIDLKNAISKVIRGCCGPGKACGN